MENDLQHEDVLIKLRGKLNEEKIKLWEAPYMLQDDTVSRSLQDLAEKYATALSMDVETVLEALKELQLHSLDRSKANAQFEVTGFATFRVKATVPGEKPRVFKVQKKLDAMGSELIEVVGVEIDVTETRVKLIINGKVIKPDQSLEEQGVKNGAQIMALIMAETPEEAKKEDTMYMEMKKTRDDATLLSEYVDDGADDDQYMKLEDQSGKTVELPAVERRSLLVGLALHERGRTVARQRDYTLALLLLLEADRQFNECRSSILKTVDNWAVLQLDIAWCYLCLRSLSSAGDAAARLARAQHSFTTSYGENHQRLIALKGTAANERVLIMRLYLLQGIVAYHQNKRGEARVLLEKAEQELNALRVDETAVSALVELGWSRAQARTGLRATGGQCDAAHHFLEQQRTERDQAREKHRAERCQCTPVCMEQQRTERDQAREKHRAERERRLLGLCEDGSPVSQQLVQALISMGYSRQLAIVALRNSNNHVAEAVRLIQEQPEMLEESELSDEDTDTPSSDDSILEPDNQLVTELEEMGYERQDAQNALRLASNRIQEAVELLVAGGGHVDAENPAASTSAASPSKKRPRKYRDKNIESAMDSSPLSPPVAGASPPLSEAEREKRHAASMRKRERRQALARLTSTITTEDDDHLNTSLVEEEEFLVQYKSLL